MQVIPNVHLIPLGFVNAYLIVEEDGLVLIDAGMRASRKRIGDYLKSIGHTLQDIKLILLTHADPDHCGSAEKIRLVSGARICASPTEAQALSTGRPSRPLNLPFPFNRFMRMMEALSSPKFEVDEILQERQILPVLEELLVVPTPGHTPGHISLYAPAHKLLFAGDALRTAEKKFRRSNQPIFTDSIEQHAASFQILADLQPEIVCAGHGPVLLDAAPKFKEIPKE